MFPLKEKSNTRAGEKTLFYIPKVTTTAEKNFPQYRLPNIWNRSILNDQLKLLKKPVTLTHSYKEYRVLEYSYFKCENAKCYPCGRC